GPESRGKRQSQDQSHSRRAGGKSRFICCSRFHSLSRKWAHNGSSRGAAPLTVSLFNILDCAGTEAIFKETLTKSARYTKSDGQGARRFRKLKIRRFQAQRTC